MPGIVQYNLKGLRDAIFAQADHAPKSNTEAIARTDEFINRAYWQMAEDVPNVFFTTMLEMEVYPDVASGDLDDLEMADNPSSGKDPWVLQSVQPVGSTTTAFNTTGLWSGRTIYLYHAGQARWHTRRIREVWAGADYYIALDKPWIDTAEVTKWRIEMGAFPLPHKVIELKNMIDVNSETRRSIEVISEGVAEDYEYDPQRLASTKGDVRLAYRREHRSLPAPTFTPTFEASQTSWVGPEPEGTFEYCYTIVFGYHDVDVVADGPESQGEVYVANSVGRRHPLYESPPSPVTGVSTSTATSTELAVAISLPDMDFVLGFADANTRRNGKTGVRKRIYRRRVTSEADTGDTFTRNVETPNRFYLIDEVEGDVTSWEDDGSKTPDYSEPLQPVHGYQTIQLHPRPDERTTLRLRAVLRPLPLTDPQDYPTVHEDALNVLLYRALAFAFEAKGDLQAATYNMNLYTNGAGTLAKRYGTLVPADTPRRIARMRATRPAVKHGWMQKLSE